MLVNLTPHDLNFYAKDDRLIFTLAKSVELPPVRVKKSLDFLRTVTTSEVEIPLFQAKFNEVENLPPVKEDTCYIVSSLALQAIKEQHPSRSDIYAPDDPVRDNSGAIIGCRALTTL